MIFFADPESDRVGDVDLRDFYVTFMAGIFRSVRFGAASAHGKANMVRFNFFKEHGAFVRDAESGRYRVDFERMREAMADLSRLLLTLQGDGDYEGALELTATKGVIGDQLQADLDRLMRFDDFIPGLFDIAHDRTPQYSGKQHGCDQQHDDPLFHVSSSPVRALPLH